MAKEIWVPKSETTVTVVNGDVRVVESMTMTPKPLGRPSVGFEK